MATESATYSVDLKDGVSGPAAQAARALEQLKSKMLSDTKELREMQTALTRLRGATVVNKAAIQELTERISAKKAAIASTQERFMELGGSFAESAKAATAAGGDMSSLMGVAQSMGGPVGRLATIVGSLGTMLGVGLAAGAIAAAAAVAALTVAIVAGYTSLAKYALASSDARRSELLHLEGLMKIPNWYGLAAGKASDMQAAIDNVSMSSALGRGDIAKYGEELYRMGLRGKNLSSALEATAIKASTQGEQWASLFMQQAAGANMLGQSVEKLSNRVKNQLGEIARKQALSFGVQLTKLRENVARIFDEVEIGPFLEGLNTVVKMFSQAEVSGVALKKVVDLAFGPMFSALGANGPMLVRRFFQGFIIAALLTTIAVLKIRNALQEAFGDTKILGNVDMLEVAMWGGYAAFGVLAGILAIAGGILVTTALGMAPFVVAVSAVVAAGVGLGYAIASWQEELESLGASLAQAARWFSGLPSAIGAAAMQSIMGANSFGAGVLSALFGFQVLFENAGTELGRSITNGLVNAIRGGIGTVKDTVTGLAGALRSTFAQALGIASPSKVFAGYGKQIGAGLGGGIVSTKHDVQRATDFIAPKFPAFRIDVPNIRVAEREGPLAPVLLPVTAPAQGAARGGGRGGDRNVRVDNLNVYSSAKDAAGIAQDIRVAVINLIEGVAVEMGVEPEGLEPA